MTLRASVWAGYALIVTACQDPSSVPSRATAPPAPSERSEAPVVTAAARARTPPTLQPAPPGKPIAEAVRRIAQSASDAGEVALVYVGATWCEPCRRFKAALAAGELQKRGLRGIRFIEFDHDKDAKRLAQAGYGSRFLPLFAMPGPDGRGSARRFMGARKGTGAVDDIVPRLKALIDMRRATP